MAMLYICVAHIDLARWRLEGLLKRLRHHPEGVPAVMQEQLQQGIIEKVVEESQQNPDKIICYFLHHAVICKDKQTTKLRFMMRLHEG